MPRVHPVKIELARTGRTQVDLAEAARTTPAVLNHVLNGHQRVWPGLAERISTELGIPVAKLFPELVAS